MEIPGSTRVPGNSLSVPQAPFSAVLPQPNSIWLTCKVEDQPEECTLLGYAHHSGFYKYSVGPARSSIAPPSTSSFGDTIISSETTSHNISISRKLYPPASTTTSYPSSARNRPVNPRCSITSSAHSSASWRSRSAVRPPRASG